MSPDKQARVKCHAFETPSGLKTLFAHIPAQINPNHGLFTKICVNLMGFWGFGVLVFKACSS